MWVDSTTPDPKSIDRSRSVNVKRGSLPSHLRQKADNEKSLTPVGPKMSFNRMPTNFAEAL